MPKVRSRAAFALLAALSLTTNAQALTYGLAGDGTSWPPEARDVITRSMNEAVATFNRYGYFDKHLTANHNPGVPTAQSNVDGWIDFGPSRNARTAMHEISHTLGTGYYWATGGGQVDENTAAGRLIKVYDGQGARLSTGGRHFWPYNLNFDDEDGSAARERMCKLVSAFRFDSGTVKDSDGDTLPDDWETFHFKGLGENGDGDPDGDGVVNRFEYAADCDPKVAAPVKDGGVYVLIGQVTRRALSVTGASTAEEAGTEQRDPDGEDWQSWSVRYVGEGYFSFSNVKSGLVLEVPSTDTSSGLPIRQAKWTGALKQQWRVTVGPGGEAGYYLIANRETGRVVDGVDGADGAVVKQYPFIGDIPQQFWRFQVVAEPVDAGAGTGGSGGGTGSGGANPGAGGSGSNGQGGSNAGAGGGPVSTGGATPGFGGSNSVASGGAMASNGGAASGGVTGDPTSGDDSSDGCDCGIASTPGTSAPHLLSVLAGAWLWRRQQRRRTRTKTSA